MPIAQEAAGLDHKTVAAILACVLCQGELDAELEAAQAQLPLGLLEVVFDTLDRYNRGYISDADLYQFMQDVPGTPVSYWNLCELVKDIQMMAPTPVEGAGSGGRGFGISLDMQAESGRPVAWREGGAKPGRLYLRDLALALLAPGSRERRVVERASSDEEARSMLFVLRHSTPCSGCGADAHRDADARNCPLVICPFCGTVFECLVVAESSASSSAKPPPTEVLSSFRALIEVAARTVEKCELAREHLAELANRGPHGGMAPLLAEVYRKFADGRPSMTIGDFRRGIATKGLGAPEDVLRVAWRRYARGGETVDLPEFLRQLRPRAVAGLNCKVGY